MVVGLDGGRQSKWRDRDVMAESRVVRGTSFSFVVTGWNIQLSYAMIPPVQVSSNTACLIEYKKI